ncbi:MAG: A/G-specific adenine glycosylase [Betaproteobacteria bacterium]|nr:A/G-specific adenine glycosylase [Betaproteobacteria bacterium]
MLPDFASRVVAWQRAHGRHDLPWQGGHDPYPVWVSEIMLQQTRVDSVIPYYTRFLARFPDLATLAAADEDDVLALWSGLGYYSRARNLHATARRILAEHDGRFPIDPEVLATLPGIGRSTAAAIAALAFGQRRAILDGNVKRVLARVFGIEGWPGERAVENELWRLADALLPDRDLRAYTQGLMDLGATLCTRAAPRCEVCPLGETCLAHRQGRQRRLPAPRPRKSVPERSVAMLVLLHAGSVLLEKRPPTGVWGGLWSLPECAEAEEPGEVAECLGCRVVDAVALPIVSHAFTHFRLRIQPWRLRAQPLPGAAEPGRLWLDLNDIEGAALPSPVRRILLDARA